MIIEKKSSTTSPFTMNLETKNILIGIQSEQKEKQMIGLSGQVNFEYEQNGEHDAHQEFHKDEGDEEFDESSANRSSFRNKQQKNISMSVKAQELELSNIYIKDLYGTKINYQSRKRNIMKQTEFEFQDQQFNCDCQEELKQIQKTQIIFKKAICHLSYKDLDLLYSTMKYQKILKENSKKFDIQFDHTYHKKTDSQLISIGSLAHKTTNNLQQEKNIVSSEVFDSNYKSFHDQGDNINSFNNQKRLGYTKKQTFLVNQTNYVQANSQVSQILNVQNKPTSYNIMSGVSMGQKSIIKNNRNTISRKQLSEMSISKSQKNKKIERICQIFILTGDSVEVLVINDLNQAFIPMIHLNFQLLPDKRNEYEVPEIKYIEEMGKGKLTGVCMFEIEYFNPSVGKMEPIIEEACFKLFYLFDDQKDQKEINIVQYLNEEYDIKPIINVNISDRMIAVLYKSFKYWRKRLLSTSAKLNPDMQQLDLPMNMEQSMLHSIQHPSAQMSRQITRYGGEASAQKEFVTLFSFHNMTGYLLTVRKHQKDQKTQPINIDVGKTSTFQIEPDEENFAKTFESQYQVMVSFETRGKQTYQINDIKSDRERQDIYLWQTKRKEDRYSYFSEQVEEKSKEQQYENHKIIQETFTTDYINNYEFSQQNHHFFLSSIKLDDVRKTIILSSCFVIQNKLQFKVYVKLQNKNVGYQFEIEKNKIGAIPHEFMDRNTSISIQGNPKNSRKIIEYIIQKIIINILIIKAKLSQYSTPQSLHDLFQLQANQSKEIFHNPFYCLVKKYQDTIIKNRVMLVLDTLLKFQNMLPLPINISFEYQLNDKSRIAEIEKSRNLFDKEYQPNPNKNYISLKHQQMYLENYGSYYSKIEIQAWIVGYSPSENFLVYERGSKESSYPKQLVLKDINGKKQIIHIERIFEGGSVKINFYCKLCLINTTGLEITVYKKVGKILERAQGQQQGVELQLFQQSFVKQDIHAHNNNDLFNNLNCDSSHHSQFSAISNKLMKQKSLFDHYPQENESINENKDQQESQVSNQQVDQFFHRVIILNEDDEDIALSLIKMNTYQDLEAKDKKFKDFNIKKIINKDQDHIDIQLRTPEIEPNKSLASNTSFQKTTYLYDLAVRLNEHQLNNSNLYTKILTIIPRYVIVNQASVAIEICQTDTNNITILATKQRIIQKWNEIQQFQLKIRPSTQFNWSGGIPVKELKTYNFYCSLQPQSISDTENYQQELFFMNASVEQAGPITYVIIKDVQGDDIPYLIINDCEEVKIEISQLLKPQQQQPQSSVESQKNIQSQRFTNSSHNQINTLTQNNLEQKNEHKDKPLQIFPQDQARFSWQYPSESSQIEAIFSIIKIEENSRGGSCRAEIDLQSVNFEDQIICEIKYKNKIVRVQQNTQFKGMTRIITFSENNGEYFDKKTIDLDLGHINTNNQLKSQYLDGQRQDLTQKNEIDFLGEGLKMNICIKEIGFSVIFNLLGQNKEINYLLMKNIDVSLIQNKEFRDVSIDVKFIQIDNTTDQDSITPIILTPKFYRQIMEHPENKTLIFKFKQNHLAQAVIYFQF